MGSYKRSLIAAMTFFLILDALVVAARVYVRTKLVRALGWDDALLCLAFFGYFMACTVGFISIHYGYAADAGEHQTYFNTTKMNKFYWANQLCLYLSSGIVKIAVALVLYRLAMNVKTRVTLAISIVVVVIWTTVMTVFSSDLCADNPSGATNYAGSKTCADVGLFRMISNIFIDYFFALYPISMLWKAKLAKQMKIIVCGLLGLGILASAATLAKLVILVKLQQTSGVQEDWLHYQLLEWADIEVGLAIFAASAAALRPLYRRLSGHSLPEITATEKSATAAASSATAQVAVPDPSQQRLNHTYEQQHPGRDSASDTNSSGQYELRTFNSREPTLKMEDEELGQQLPAKQTHSISA